MKILYDGLIYSWQAPGGISRYFANIIKRLPTSWRPVLTVTRRPPVNFPKHHKLRTLCVPRFRPRRISIPLSRAIFQSIEKFIDFDVVHPTYYSLLAGHDMGNFRAKSVLTVHDMIHEIFKKDMDPTGQGAEEKKRAILAADAIICISESTKRDLLERIPEVAGRVSVTHLASDITGAMGFGTETVPSEPYILYVGSRAPYKNFTGLVRSFAIAAAKYSDLRLCVVGPPLSPDELKMLAGHKVADKAIDYGHINDAHLAKLYRLSLAFAYPSLHEGFGIPPLEAMACGTPVIASACSSLPEVVGAAALLVPPGVDAELAEAMLYLYENPSARAQLIGAGKERVKLFSWEKTAQETTEIYRSLA